MNLITLSTRTALAGLVMSAGAVNAPAAELPDFVHLVQQAGPAVVNISTTQKVAANAERGTMQNLPPGPWGDFMKRFFEEVPWANQSHDVRSLGSGFIISPDGYILTNAHVVKNADSVVVGLADHREETAQVVGRDDRADVAVLKIAAKDLPVVKVGDSDRLQVGQWVLAIGSPFGLEHTATHGTVSALGRTLPSDTYVRFIQTDVAVNPGNSGGPLFDTDGRVVGINAQIYSDTGGYMGLSFAIPINLAMRVADQLKDHGQVSYGWLGVGVQSLDRKLAASFGLDQPKGALVTQVTPDSPASRAGVKAGDVILAYDGQPVVVADDLPPLVGGTPVGRRVKLEVMSQGKNRSLEVTIAELQAQADRSPSRGGGQQGSARETGLGLLVRDLDPRQRQELGLSDRGVQVEDVQGPAAKGGVKAGDLILSLNQQDITSAKQLRGLVRQLPAGKPTGLGTNRSPSPSNRPTRPITTLLLGAAGTTSRRKRRVPAPAGT
jgi:serine protease Do